MTDSSRSLGVQAYRWWISSGVVVIAALLLRVLNQIDKTADKVIDIQNQVTEIKGTVDATRGNFSGQLDAIKGTIDQRLNTHERRLDAVERGLQGQQGRYEEIQKQLWQRKP